MRSVYIKKSRYSAIPALNTIPKVQKEPKVAPACIKVNKNRTFGETIYNITVNRYNILQGR